jgi:DedD protein
MLPPGARNPAIASWCVARSSAWRRRCSAWVYTEIVEGPVKERLTGALILVALLVIVVPEMLSGPDEPAARNLPAAEAGPPLRTYSLQLDGATTGRSQDQSALSPKAVEAPAPAASGPVAAQTDSAPKTAAVAAASGEDAVTPAATEQTPATSTDASSPKPAPAASTTATVPKPVPATAPVKPVASASASRPESGGQWWAQLGSFASRDNAERLTRELRAAGYSVNLARVQAGGKELYRVRAGPESTREAVVRLQARLAAAGHKSSLVAP